jgi:hypothetical protein
LVESLNQLLRVAEFGVPEKAEKGTVEVPDVVYLE